MYCELYDAYSENAVNNNLFSYFRFFGKVIKIAVKPLLIVHGLKNHYFVLSITRCRILQYFRRVENNNNTTVFQTLVDTLSRPSLSLGVAKCGGWKTVGNTVGERTEPVPADMA